MNHPQMIAIPCTLMRGGTSKGLYIMERDLPADPVQRDAMILAMYGSPDRRQIDGVGGADPLTSKVAIIGPSSRPDADVDYTFGQVSIKRPFIDYKGNCGNISAGVGAFAIEKGLVKAQSPTTTVRIHMTNSGRILRAEVPTVDDHAAVDGNLVIDGCPGTGACVTLDWSDTAGAFTGKLLPTGKPKDIFVIDGREYEVSLVDCANPLVFIKASSLGMRGTETPEEIEQNPQLMALIERIRSRAAVLFGLVEKEEDAPEKSPYNPFFCIISAPAGYTAMNGRSVSVDEIDIVSRLLFMHQVHKTHPGTGTVCLGAAARIAGTLVNETLRPEAAKRLVIRIGHPSGVIPVEAEAQKGDDGYTISRAAIYRTARVIMDGSVFVKKNG